MLKKFKKTINETSKKNCTKKLIKAVMKNDFQKIVKYLKNGADANAVVAYSGDPILIHFVNRSNREVDPILIHSVNRSNREIVKLLLHYKADINVANINGCTALICAVQQNNFELAKFLLENNANINTPSNNGKTPLMYATKSNNFKIIKLLLENKADVNSKSNNGDTALQFLPIGGYGILDTVKLLVKYGADFNIPDNKGLTFLNRFILANQQNIVNFLVECNKNKNISESIRRIINNSRILSQGSKQQNSIASKLPAELWVNILAENNDPLFDKLTRYNIAFRFFRRPPTSETTDMKQYSSETHQYIKHLKQISI